MHSEAKDRYQSATESTVASSSRTTSTTPSCYSVESPPTNGTEYGRLQIRSQSTYSTGESSASNGSRPSYGEQPGPSTAQLSSRSPRSEATRRPSISSNRSGSSSYTARLRCCAFP
ncbi:hypothetical protein HPB50_002565 [Hyalomma asiaticum]|uniref:Uncharacterized protein n=1 Tax=Hyalomma asiaticum TaxID=266040 RepID=A0ACB7TDA0_HYAAI|nr:hypothetical protein HPB50_002565 [Hyalomma asiaticum]